MTTSSSLLASETARAADSADHIPAKPDPAMTIFSGMIFSCYLGVDIRNTALETAFHILIAPLDSGYERDKFGLFRGVMKLDTADDPIFGLGSRAPVPGPALAATTVL